MPGGRPVTGVICALVAPRGPAAAAAPMATIPAPPHRPPGRTGASKGATPADALVAGTRATAARRATTREPSSCEEGRATATPATRKKATVAGTSGVAATTPRS